MKSPKSRFYKAVEVGALALIYAASLIVLATPRPAADANPTAPGGLGEIGPSAADRGAVPGGAPFIPTPAAVPATPAATPAPSSRPRTPRARLRGDATWYCNANPARAQLSRCRIRYPDGAGADLYAAAGPELRAAIGPGWKGTRVTVTAAGRSVTVTLVDSCGAGCTVAIDLYADAFAQLAALSRGRLEEVTIGLP